MLLVQTGLLAQTDSQTPNFQWQPLESNDGSALTARHEAAGVVVGNAIYLIGGRGNRPLERFSLDTGQWENLGLAPLELHHVQPVVVGTDILLVGAFSCCYPQEQIVAEIHVFDTVTDTWRIQGSLPADRLRGSAAAVVHEGLVYLLGGNTLGHNGGAVPWFDEYDPSTGAWRVLPDAPNARDHFSAVMIGNELVAAAGRQTRMPNPAANPVQAVDIYDFETASWRSAASIPTLRGGAVAVAYGGEVIVAGGEINLSNVALDVVEAYNPGSDQWRTLSAMSTGRHGSGGGVLDNHFIMLSGASRIGGSHETGDAEILQLPEPQNTGNQQEPLEPDNPEETATDTDTDTGRDEGNVGHEESDAEGTLGEPPPSTKSGGGAFGPMLFLALLTLWMRRSVRRNVTAGLR